MATESLHIHADTHELKDLARKMAVAAPAARKAAQVAIRAELVLIERDAADRASFSERISGSGKVRMAGFNGSITFGGGSAFFAVPVENSGRGNVSHPTFGHEPVTSKGSHPAFLAPAFAAHAEEAIDVLTEQVTKAIAEMLDR